MFDINECSLIYMYSVGEALEPHPLHPDGFKKHIKNMFNKFSS